MYFIAESLMKKTRTYVTFGVIIFWCQGNVPVREMVPSVFRKRPGVTLGVFTFKPLKYRYAIATPDKQKSRQPPANADNFGSNRISTAPHLVPLESNYT